MSELPDPSNHLGPDGEVSGEIFELLQSASTVSSRPWSALLGRLQVPGGMGWALLRIESYFGKGATPTSIPLDRLSAVKDSAKLEVVSATEGETQATAWLAYAISVATAAVMHDTRLTGMPKATWIDLFANLSALAPEPWATVFEDAVTWWSAQEDPPATAS